MKKIKHSITARNAIELAKVLGLKKEDAIAMEFRAKLNQKIVEMAAARNFTHTRLAGMTGASRTRITSVLNGRTLGVSTDFMLRLLCAMGCKTSPTFSIIRPAA